MTSRVILIHNPYSETGGGAEFQAPLRAMLQQVVPSATIRELRAAAVGRGASDYVRQGLLAHRSRRLLQNCNLLIVQGFLNIGSWALTREAARLGVPYILVPHGDYVPPWNWRGAYRSAIRKKLASALYGRSVLRKAAAIVVGSTLEGERICDSSSQFQSKLKVIPNAIESDFGSEDDAVTESNAGAPFALWLGRAAPEKQLDFIIACWPEVVERVSGAELVLAGSFENEPLAARLRDQIRNLGLTGAVRFMGYLGGAEKRRMLRMARCLVLPSRVESFGRVVVESLAVGTPVLVSTGTPWHDLPEGAGACIPVEHECWVSALARILATPDRVPVPRHDVDRILASCSPVAVLAAWRRLLGEVMSSVGAASSVANFSVFP